MAPLTPRFCFPRALLLGIIAALVWPVPAAAATKLKFSSVAEYGKCVERYEASLDTCLDALHAFVKGHPGEAFAAGKAVRAKVTHWAAIPFFAKAFAHRDKKGDSTSYRKRCADEDVAMALVSALSLPASYKDVVESSRTILFDRCWEETHQAVLVELTRSGPESAIATNLCPTLIEKKQASEACQRKPAPPAPVVEAPKWQELDPKSVAVEDPVKVFKGGEGKTLTMAKVKGDDAYLIKFEGFRGPWTGRVVLHREQPASSGYDYFTQVNGSRWVSVVARGQGTLFYEVYPNGDKGPFSVFYDDDASRATKAKSLLDQFVKQVQK